MASGQPAPGEDHLPCPGGAHQPTAGSCAGLHRGCRRPAPAHRATTAAPGRSSHHRIRLVEQDCNQDGPSRVVTPRSPASSSGRRAGWHQVATASRHSPGRGQPAQVRVKGPKPAPSGCTSHMPEGEGVSMNRMSRPSGDHCRRQAEAVTLSRCDGCRWCRSPRAVAGGGLPHEAIWRPLGDHSGYNFAPLMPASCRICAVRADDRQAPGARSSCTGSPNRRETSAASLPRRSAASRARYRSRSDVQAVETLEPKSYPPMIAICLPSGENSYSWTVKLSGVSVTWAEPSGFTSGVREYWARTAC